VSDLIKCLRDGAENIHSIGPARAADLLREAASVLEMVAPPRIVAGEWDGKPGNPCLCGEVLASDHGTWLGWSTVDDEDPNEPICGAEVPTPLEALDSCADACDVIENPEGEDE
jgi:hypothetical protein